MVFAIGVFGNLFTGMLNTCLYSIHKNSPHSEVFIFYQNIDSSSFLAIKKAFPKVNFIETKFNLEEKFQRRGSKMLFWEVAAYELSKLGHTDVCFMDVDTLVLKDISKFYKEEFDIGFSIKNEIWPLNTGVILMKLSDKVLGFMAKWKEEAFMNVRNPENYTKAKSHNYPFGGPDQMAFHELLSFQTEKTNYQINDLVFKGFDFKLFNETRSTLVTPQTHIIHYKGGWQRVLINGETFTRKRTLKDSEEMYILYIKNAKEGLEYINGKTGNDLKMEDIGIAWPSYLGKDYKINLIQYKLIQSLNKTKYLIKVYSNSLMKKLKLNA